MNKKLDKSLLPQPQKPIGWKKGVLQISTGSKTDLNNQPAVTQNYPATTKFSNSNKTTFNNNFMNEQSHQQTPSSRNQMNRQSRQSIPNSSKRPMGMTESQYSLEQKELLTFAANQSNQDENQADERGNEGMSNNQGSQSRQNRFRQSSQNQQQLDSSSQQQPRNINRSSSKNKQHKTIIYTHNLPQPQEFISYSVITKQSKSGMFSNQKLLLINSFKRQLMYFSKLPKVLPFVSYKEMDKKYLNDEKPKEIVELDRVRRFMFVPAKGSLATVAVSYVNQQGERKEWKLGMGNISVMNEWIQLVNEVFKKEHYSVVKSQVKYPPKPKKQPQNKPNNYQTKFTKTLKQQVLPTIRQSSLKTSKANQNQLNQSQLSGSGLKSTKNAANLSGSREKQYIVDKSKFINTKSYIIDMEDVSNEDIFYEPEKIIAQEKQQTPPRKESQQQINQNQTSQHNVNSSKYWQGNNEQLDGSSRFSRQLQQKQKDINSQHKNRISTFARQQTEQQKPIPVPDPQPIILSKKSSNQRLSQTTHKDLNIHIDSRVVFEEMERQREISESNSRNEERKQISTSQVYEPYTKEMIMPATVVNHVKKVIPQQEEIYSQQDQYRTRTYTQTTPHKKQQPAQQNKLPQPQQIHFTQNSDSLRSSSQSFTPQKPSLKPRPHLQQPPPNRYSRNRSNNSYITEQNSQIEDIIVGGRLHEGYILNFSPHSFSNNWLRLWLETDPMNRVEVYAAFVKACSSIVARIVDSPQNFINSYSLEKNNTHITFTAQNITFKLAFKLPLPQGLGQFISVMDFIRSQDFLSQVFKHDTQLHHEYHNYQYILNQLSNEFNSGPLSLPVYFPMCCLMEFKGISVLCKASLETAGLTWQKVAREEVRRFESEIEYVEEACHVRFGRQDNQPFDLYSIYLPSFSKSIIYMDNLSRFLPLLSNPLQKNSSLSLQLNSSYIQQHIKKGMISSRKDIDEIEKHIGGTVVKRYGEHILQQGHKIVSENDLAGLLYEKGGLKEEYLGMVYRRVEECEQKSKEKGKHVSELVLTEIILNEYLKAVKLYFMKEYFKQLYSLVSNSSTPKSHFSKSQLSHHLMPISSTLSRSFNETVLEMLHYLIYRNSKVWNVLCVALDEKYGITEFRGSGNQRHTIDALMGKVNVEYLVLGLKGKLGVECEIKSWSEGMRWGTLPLNEDNLGLTPFPLTQCYPLSLFNPEYGKLIRQLQEISQTNEFSYQLIERDIYPAILQTLNLSQQSSNNQTTLIKSSSYHLLEHGFENERILVDLSLSHFIHAFASSDLNLNSTARYKTIDLYCRLLNQEMVRSSRDVSLHGFEISFNGIKWLIKQKEYELVEVLIEQQLQAIDIWYTQNLLEMKCKFLDLAAIFYHKKLGNRNNLGVEYALKSLKLVMENRSFLPLSVCAQKCFQAANIHFQCSMLPKALQLYQLAQQYVFQSQKHKSLSQTDLSIEFLKIYLRKAEINLTVGKKNEALYDCLQCLRKSEQFEDLIGEDKGVQKDKEDLEQLQISVFQLIFRCYEIGKNLADMERITQLGCNKFVQDKVLIYGTNSHTIKNNRVQDRINPSVLSKLLKMSWISTISKLSQQHPSSQKQQGTLSKTFTPSSSKSFCLSLSQSRKPLKSNAITNLQQLQEKLQALTKLYPKSRYDFETLAMFVCQQVEEAKIRAGKNINRKEYHLIGNRRKCVSGRVERIIGERREQETEISSVLYDRLSEVVEQLSGCRQDKGNRSRNKIQRFNTQSYTNNQPQRRYSRQSRQKSIQHSPPLPYTTSKKPNTRNYHSNQITTSQFDPFPPSQQNQPELRMSYILGAQKREQNDLNRIGAYNMYSLKDEMDRKYMLVEALFGLCGREFVLGCVRDNIENRRLKDGGNKSGAFYE